MIYFHDHVLDVGSVGASSQPIELEFNLTLLGHQPNSGFNTNFPFRSLRRR
jgi:hypothetical protein